MTRAALRAPTPIVLCILDGFGLAAAGPNNAIHMARTPNWDGWWSSVPHSTLSASGEDVGLPAGQFGNSEVGHLNLGAGRIVAQDILRISQAIQDQSFFEIAEFIAACQHIRKTGGALHLLGLISDGGVHSHLAHLPGFLELARRQGIDRVFLHAFLDGRDTPPRSALQYVSQVHQMFGRSGRGHVATVSGRYFAMDRDQRWDRTEKAYRALVHGEGRPASSFREAVEAAYAAGEDDEFVTPTSIVAEQGKTVATIESGDACLSLNFRPDRMRQITRVLALADSPFERPRHPENLQYVCLTQYNAGFGLPIAFPPRLVTNTLGDVYAAHGLRQLRLAETEKYAHVTYFFSGGREQPMDGEERVLVPSATVATYDLEPAMKAREITDEFVTRFSRERFPLVVMNYANADMVGHTGVLSATVRSLEVLDECLGRVDAAVTKAGGILAITADHGNAEQMWDDSTRLPHTAHTGQTVPFVLLGLGREPARMSHGILADVAPTLLSLAGLEIPAAMTGCPRFLSKPVSSSRPEPS